MPGAALEEVVDERNFLGSVKVKVGAITASYKGKVEFTEIDEPQRRIAMTAEGRETGGGTAKGSITLRVNALPGGGSELVTEANIDLTGRIMQVGRGMIQGVSHQLFKKFAASAKQLLEAGEVPGVAGTAMAVPEQTPVRILPLIFHAIIEAIVRFIRRIFGRQAG
jgi:carbon monoxide dehydrogenase subunit G